MRALSVRQPYAELIMRGDKKIEYRSKPTKVRGRVHRYAAKRPGKIEDPERGDCGRESCPRAFTDPNEKALSLAKEWGADETVKVEDGYVDTVLEMTDGRGAEVVFDYVG